MDHSLNPKGKDCAIVEKGILGSKEPSWFSLGLSDNKTYCFGISAPAFKSTVLLLSLCLREYSKNAYARASRTTVLHPFWNVILVWAHVSWSFLDVNH